MHGKEEAEGGEGKGREAQSAAPPRCKAENKAETAPCRKTQNNKTQSPLRKARKTQNDKTQNPVTHCPAHPAGRSNPAARPSGNHA